MEKKTLSREATKPAHPGELIRGDILPATGLTQDQFAQRLGVSRRTINEIVNERRPLSVDMAIRLARFLNTTPDVWINMQTALDLWEASRTNKNEYEKIRPMSLA